MGFYKQLLLAGVAAEVDVPGRWMKVIFIAIPKYLNG